MLVMLVVVVVVVVHGAVVRMGCCPTGGAGCIRRPKRRLKSSERRHMTPTSTLTLMVAKVFFRNCKCKSLNYFRFKL